MPRKIMRTLWDIDSDLHEETMSTNSVVSDSYTTGNIRDLREKIEDDGQEEDVEGGEEDNKL